jgi:hypothetical protein
MTLLTSKVRRLGGETEEKSLACILARMAREWEGGVRFPPQQVCIRKVGRWEGTLPREGGVRHHSREDTDEDSAPKSEEREEREMAL